MRNEISVAHMLDALISAIVASGSNLVIDGSFDREIGPLVEHHTLEAKSPERLVVELSETLPTDRRVLDFGCGTGGHKTFLERHGFKWVGLNYKDGMADDAARKASLLDDQNIYFYDGVNIPFEDHCFDLVYSFQVFEHIQDIGRTFEEISRILRPGGYLVGAVSYLEQYHDYSTFNFTPYGFKLACERSGLMIDKIYPRSDVFSFLLRRLLVVTSASDENSLSDTIKADNNISNIIGNYASSYADTKSGNLLKLMFCTHFAFKARKV